MPDRKSDLPLSGSPQPASSDADRARVTRRGFLQSAAVVASTFAVPRGDAIAQQPSAAPSVPPQYAAPMAITLKVNGQSHSMQLEPRVTLLDALREYLHLAGTKKGCDRGQCGACTVLIDGRRINACLTLAIMQQGREITTIEGLAQGDQLHPMQSAFIEADAFQCGYCTPGQICSAVAAIDEMNSGTPSAATAEVRHANGSMNDAEIRERMSGNICRCGAYPNIVAAVKTVMLQKA